MPALLIHKVGGSWIAAPANSGGIQYTFEAIEGDQVIAMQQLSAAMQEGPVALESSISEVFQVPVGVEESEVVGQLFETTDQIVYLSRVVYGTVGDDMLLDVIEEAGQALAMVIF